MRSAYSAEMAFYRDQPTIKTSVQWSFVPDTNPLMPWDHCFYSRIYERHELPPEAIGEQYHPHPWAGGKPPFPLSVGGPCGTEYQWQHGALSTDSVPGVWPGSQVPLCCPGPPPSMVGGLGIGGNWYPSVGQSFCMPCPIAPLVWNCTFSGLVDRSPPCDGTGFTPTCSQFNGRVTPLAYASTCQWFYNSPFGGSICGDTVQIGLFYGSVWQMYLSFNSSLVYTLFLTLVGTFDCFGTNVFTGSIPVGPTWCSGATITATVVPG